MRNFFFVEGKFYIFPKGAKIFLPLIFYVKSFTVIFEAYQCDHGILKFT